MTRKRVAENFLKYNKMKMLRENDSITKLKNIEVLPVPDKSASDRKNYKWEFMVKDNYCKLVLLFINFRLIRLSNGLKTLLISDPMVSDDDTVDEETDSEGESSSSESTASHETKNSTHSESENSHDDKDNNSEKKLAAAALMVDVGFVWLFIFVQYVIYIMLVYSSFSDPPEIQGLAHFLEHMIFMGSKKYPEENEYDSYIKVGFN